MKIVLRQEDHCSVLDIQGNIDVHNFSVLKAGLSKLMKNGKNRIVLNLEEAKDLSSDVIRELAILDVFARELSGKLVLASANPDLKIKVTAFAKPPVVGILPTVAMAVAYLKDLDSLEGDEGGESFNELKEQLEAKAKLAAALEAQLAQLDPKELSRIRAENALLREKVKLLETQVGELAARRRQPADAEGFLEKFSALEETIRRLGTEKLEAGAKK